MEHRGKCDPVCCRRLIGPFLLGRSEGRRARRTVGTSTALEVGQSTRAVGFTGTDIVFDERVENGPDGGQKRGEGVFFLLEWVGKQKAQLDFTFRGWDRGRGRGWGWGWGVP